MTTTPGASEAMTADWQPTSENINALPSPVRKYIHALETDCDPAGTIRSEVILREHLVPELRAHIDAQAAEIAALKAELATARNDALESAAKVCERRAADRFSEFGVTEWDTNFSYYPGKDEDLLNSLDEEDDDCAKAIRALKGPTP